MRFRYANPAGLTRCCNATKRAVSCRNPQESIPMIGGVHHTGISTPDIQRLIAFYRDVMGFELCFEMAIDTPTEQVDAMLEMEGVTAKMAMMRTGTSFIELLQFDTPAGAPRG
ncbi:MAG: hypothetical protein EOP61_25300, partial [Sphingomonadales bacterium]